jgi:hypothetical protein
MVKPYISSEDIDKGSRWSIELARELESSSYGIICVTQDNMDAPWLNFEAGALSKAFDASRVSPFLFKVRPSDLTGPLTQFQATSHDREDVFRLLEGINGACGESALDALRLGKVFDHWWPDLDDRLIHLRLPDPQSKSETERGDTEILEEVLELVRGQQRLLATPETLLPPSYLKSLWVEGPNLHIRRGSTFAFYEDHREFNRVVEAQMSFAASDVTAVCGGHQLMGPLRNLDIVTQWAETHPAAQSRRLFSPFLDNVHWEPILRVGKSSGSDEHAVRVMSEDSARFLGEFEYLLIDGEQTVLSVPLFKGGGITTDDREVMAHLHIRFEALWSHSMALNEFIEANSELFAGPPDEVEEVDSVPEDLYWRAPGR